MYAQRSVDETLRGTILRRVFVWIVTAVVRAARLAAAETGDKKRSCRLKLSERLMRVEQRLELPICAGE